MKTRLQYDHLIVAIAVLVGFVAGARQINDNSMLVHITTGMSILNTHHVPRTDPYSFSAAGHAWIVQSWLPELLYAVMIKLGGVHLLQLFNGVLFAGVAGIIATLSRCQRLGQSLLATTIALGVGYAQWSVRPTTFGLLFFALTVLVVSKRRSFFWLIPIGLLWVNSHGSWPLGLGWMVLAGIGARADRDNTDAYLKYLAAFILAVGIGGLASPAGPDVLAFPAIAFGEHSAVFRNIAEWGSPDFHSSDILGGRLLLLTFCGAVVVLARQKQKWAALLPTLGLMVAALVGLRNLPLLGVALAPVLASVLQQPKQVADVTKQRLLSIGLAAFVAIGALDLVPTYSKSAYDFDSYPVAAFNYLDQQGLTGPNHRIAGSDVTGCYQIFRYGTRANNFIDDRYDMYPVQVSNDSTALLRVGDSTSEVLYRYGFDAVLTGTNSSLGRYLSVNSTWRQVWNDKHWKIYEPVSKAL